MENKKTNQNDDKYTLSRYIIYKNIRIITLIKYF